MLRQLLSQYEFSTCKPQIELLSPEELLLTWKKLAILGFRQTTPQGQFVFRRERKENLYRQLNCDSEELLFSRLFYFGEKAKYYHKEFLRKKKVSYEVSDCCSDVAENIFLQIANELSKKLSNKHPKFISFAKYNESFLDFFQENTQKNKTYFIQKVTGNILFRDYYLAFLHTLGHRSQYPTHFISTSTKLQIDIEEEIADIIILYALPLQSNGFSVKTHSQTLTSCNATAIEKRLRESGLPVCNRWVYNEQFEISAKSGLFPQLIWGVFDMEKKRFIVNPHMFEPKRKLEDLFLDFDQSDFERRLADTSYHMGTLLKNGEFSNIFPQR